MRFLIHFQVRKLLQTQVLSAHIISRGDGPNVQAGSDVRVHYYGYLTENNQKFDSSFERGEPISLPSWRWTSDTWLGRRTCIIAARRQG